MKIIAETLVNSEVVARFKFLVIDRKVLCRRATILILTVVLHTEQITNNKL